MGCLKALGRKARPISLAHQVDETYLLLDPVDSAASALHFLESPTAERLGDPHSLTYQVYVLRDVLPRSQVDLDCRAADYLYSASSLLG